MSEPGGNVDRKIKRFEENKKLFEEIDEYRDKDILKQLKPLAEMLNLLNQNATIRDFFIENRIVFDGIKERRGKFFNPTSANLEEFFTGNAIIILRQEQPTFDKFSKNMQDLLISFKIKELAKAHEKNASNFRDILNAAYGGKMLNEGGRTGHHRAQAEETAIKLFTETFKHHTDNSPKDELVMAFTNLYAYINQAIQFQQKIAQFKPTLDPDLTENYQTNLAQAKGALAKVEEAIVMLEQKMIRFLKSEEKKFENENDSLNGKNYDLCKGGIIKPIDMAEEDKFLGIKNALMHEMQTLQEFHRELIRQQVRKPKPAERLRNTSEQHSERGNQQLPLLPPSIKIAAVRQTYDENHKKKKPQEPPSSGPKP